MPRKVTKPSDKSPSDTAYAEFLEALRKAFGHKLRWPADVAAAPTERLKRLYLGEMEAIPFSHAAECFEGSAAAFWKTPANSRRIAEEVRGYLALRGVRAFEDKGLLAALNLLRRAEAEAKRVSARKQAKDVLSYALKGLHPSESVGRGRPTSAPFAKLHEEQATIMSALQQLNEKAKRSGSIRDSELATAFVISEPCLGEVRRLMQKIRPGYAEAAQTILADRYGLSPITIRAHISSQRKTGRQQLDIEYDIRVSMAWQAAGRLLKGKKDRRANRRIAARAVSEPRLVALWNALTEEELSAHVTGLTSDTRLEYYLAHAGSIRSVEDLCTWSWKVLARRRQ